MKVVKNLIAVSALIFVCCQAAPILAGKSMANTAAREIQSSADRLNDKTNEIAIAEQENKVKYDKIRACIDAGGDYLPCTTKYQ